LNISIISIIYIREKGLFTDSVKSKKFYSHSITIQCMVKSKIIILK